jgi:hypothetical protein
VEGEKGIKKDKKGGKNKADIIAALAVSKGDPLAVSQPVSANENTSTTGIKGDSIDKSVSTKTTKSSKKDSNKGAQKESSSTNEVKNSKRSKKITTAGDNQEPLSQNSDDNQLVSHNETKAIKNSKRKVYSFLYKYILY